MLEARVVPDDFHARYAAHTKTYLYRIHNSPIDSPFASRYYTKVPGRLDADRMQQAAQYFVGTHDFLALCASGSSAAAHGDTVRTITACEVERRGDDIDITVTADGYLYNMVRILAGTLCEAGAGRLAPGRCRASSPAATGKTPARRWRQRGFSSRAWTTINTNTTGAPGGGMPFGSTVVAGRGQERMRKKHRDFRPASDEPLSEGRVEYLEQARAGAGTGASGAPRSSSRR